MKFTFNGNTYKITFQYDKHYVTEDIRENSSGLIYGIEVVNQISTTCFIYLLQANGNKQLIGSGVAKCQTEHDNFCKETGRKLALTRALEEAGTWGIYNRTFIDNHVSGKDLCREFRTAAWKAYFSRKNND